MFLAGPTGFEPAISSVTGRRDNHFTTSPRGVCFWSSSMDFNSFTGLFQGVPAINISGQKCYNTLGKESAAAVKPA